MKIPVALLALSIAMNAGGAAAQIRPSPAMGDQRIQTVEYRPDQVVEIDASPGYQVTIQLAPDEQVQSIAIGDAGGWQVSASRSGNFLFLKPVRGGADTNMTVITSVRIYAFDLRSSAGTAPYQVQFRYPASDQIAAAQGAPPGPVVMIGSYKLHGSRTLYPSRISDDGAKTYIVWDHDVALPAVYALDRNGRETLANGNMRSNIYVIDSVDEHLLFRIDRLVARADRFLAQQTK